MCGVLPASAFHMLGLKLCTTRASSSYSCYQFCFFEPVVTRVGDKIINSHDMFGGPDKTAEGQHHFYFLVAERSVESTPPRMLEESVMHY